MPIRDKLLSLATHDLRVAFADAWVAPTKGGGDPFFNADEVLVLKAAIDIAADGGFFVTDDHLIDLMRAILNAEDRAVSHVSGKDVTIDRDFVRKWRARHKVKRYKTASLDPKRAEKATVEVRDGWFALIDRYAASPLALPAHPPSRSRGSVPPRACPPSLPAAGTSRRIGRLVRSPTPHSSSGRPTPSTTWTRPRRRPTRRATRASARAARTPTA
jgi:hypothetical protein